VNNDLLKIIVDAELQKETSLEKSLNGIIEKYNSKPVEIEVKVKNSKGKGNDIVDDKVVKQLQDNLKAMQMQVEKLQSGLSKSLSGGFEEGVEGVKKLQSALKDLQKTASKTKYSYDSETGELAGKFTTVKTKTGNKLNSTTTTTKETANGTIMEEETVRNYQKVTDYAEKLKKTLEQMKGVTSEQKQELREMLNIFEKTYGKNSEMSDKIGTKEFQKDMEKIDKSYDKLVEREMAYEKAIQRRIQANNKVKKFLKDANENLPTEYLDKINKELNGKNGKGGIDQLKTLQGVENRYNKILDILDDMIRKNKELNQIQNNQKSIDKEKFFADRRINKTAKWVDDSKENWIKSSDIDRVRESFEKINATSKDWTIQLKLAKEELKQLEKHAQGLSNYQDAQNDTRKKMNLDIKKDRNDENLNDLLGRGVISEYDDRIKQFKQLNESLTLESTKADIEAINKLWRELIKEEREAVKAQKEFERETEKQQKTVEDLQKATSKWGAKLENVDYQSLKGLSPENYQKIEVEIRNLISDLNKLENQSEKLSNGQIDGINRSIQAIQRQASEYKDQEKTLKDLQKATSKWGDKLEQVDYQAFKGLSKQDYTKVEGEIKEVIQELNRLQNKREQLTDAEVRGINESIKVIQRQVEAYKDLARLETMRKKQGDLVDTSFDFDKLNGKNIIQNQRKIQASIGETIQQIHRMDERFGQLDEQSIRVKRDFDALGNEIYKVTYAIDRGDRKFEDYALTLNATQRQVRTLGMTMRQTRSEMSTFQQLSQAFEKAPIWAMTNGAIYGFTNQAKQGFQMIIDFDEAMTDLKKVTETTGEGLQRFASDAQELGNKLGVTATDVVKATTEFQRMNYTIKEAQGLAENSLIYSNVGDMGLEKASQSLISALKGFEESEGDVVTVSRKYIDIFNEVGNNFAITSSGIGEALERSSAILHQSGNTIEQAVALITAANTTIQDPKQVGTALKTVSMRLRGVSEEGEEIIGLIPQLEQNFNRLGLTLMQDENTFKSTYTIMGELADKWGELTDVQQAQITELIGGKHQGAIISAMIQNWADAVGAYETALNSAGSAQQEFSRFTDSFQYRIGQLKNSTEAFWSTFFDSDSVKLAIDALTKFMKVITSITETVGSAPLFTAFFATFATLVNKQLRGFVLFNQTGMSFVRIIGLMSDTMGRATGIITRFLKVNVPLMALSAVIGYVTKSIAQQRLERERALTSMQDEYDKTQQLINSYRELESAGTIDRYKTLSSMNPDDMSLEERRELLQIQQQLVDTDIVKYYDEEGKAILRTADELRELIELKEKDQQKNAVKIAEAEIDNFDFGDGFFHKEGLAKLSQQFAEVETQMKQSASDIATIDIFEDFFKNQLENLDGDGIKLKQEILEFQQELRQAMGDTSYNALEKIPEFSRLEKFIIIDGKYSAEEIRNEFQIIINSLYNNSKELQSQLSDINDKARAETQALKDSIKTVGNSVMEDAGIAFGTNKGLLAQKILEFYDAGLVSIEKGSERMRYLSKEGIGKVLQEIFDGLEAHDFNPDMFMTLDMSEQTKALEQLQKEFGLTSEIGLILSNIIKDLTEKFTDAGNEGQEVAKDFTLSEQKLAELTSQYDEAVSKVTFLNGVLEELRENHILGADTMGEIQQKYPSLLQYMGDEVAMAKAISDAVVKETDVARQAMITKLDYNEQYFKGSTKAYDALFTELSKKYQVDLSNVKNIAQAKYIVETGLIQQLAGAWSDYYDVQSDGMLKLNQSFTDLGKDGYITPEMLEIFNAVKKANNEILKVKARFDSITARQFNFSTNFKNLGVSNKKDKKPEKPKKPKKEKDPNNIDPTSAWLREKMARAEKLDSLRKELDIQQSIHSSWNDLTRVIEDQNKIIKNRKDKLLELKNVNKQIGAKLKGYNTSWVNEDGEETLTYINAYNKASVAQQEVMAKKLSQLQALMKQYSANKEEIKDLEYELKELNTELGNLKFQKLQQAMEKLAESMAEVSEHFDKMKRDLERSFAYLEDDDTSGRVELINKRINLMLREKAVIEANIKALEKQRKTLAGHEELLKQNTEEIEKWKEALRDLNVDIINSQKDIKDLYMELADKVIEEYKNALERQRDAELEALEKTMEAEDERHKQRIKHLNDEMSKFSEYINQQIKALDKEKDEDTFNRELEKKRKEIAEIQKNIDKYAMDNTLEGRKQSALLREQLAQKEEELEQFLADRQLELRKESLQDQLKDKQEQIDSLLEEEDDYHDKQKDKLDEQRDKINKYYENALADTKRWNSIRENIMSEHFENITDEMSKFIDDVSKRSETLGENIANNIITNIEKLMGLMNQLEKDDIKPPSQMQKPNKPSSVSPYKDVSEGTPFSSAIAGVTDKGIMQGNEQGYFRPKGEMTRAEVAVALQNALGLATPTDKNTYLSNYKDVNANSWYADAIAALTKAGIFKGDGQGKFNPNDIVSREQIALILARAFNLKNTGDKVNVDLSDVSSMYKSAVEAMIQNGIAQGVVGKDGKLEYNGHGLLTREQFALMLSRLMKFDTGGYTGSWGSDGKLAMLHEKELVLNKFDTKNILEAVKLIKGMEKLTLPKLPKIEIPSLYLPNPSTRGNTNGENINVEIYIDRLEGGEEGANTLVSSLTSKLKRKGLR